jgi:hypothetical protein
VRLAARGSSRVSKIFTHSKFSCEWDEAFLRRLCPRALARRRVMLRSPGIRFRPGNRRTRSRSHDRDPTSSDAPPRGAVASRHARADRFVCIAGGYTRWVWSRVRGGAGASAQGFCEFALSKRLTCNTGVCRQHTPPAAEKFDFSVVHGHDFGCHGTEFR